MSGQMEESPHTLHELLCVLSLSLQIILDTKFWTAVSLLMVTASLLFFCFLSFLTQSIDAFRIAPTVFCFPGEMPWGSPWSFPSWSQGSPAWAWCYQLFPTS